MDNHDYHGCAQIGRRNGLLCAAIGAVLALGPVIAFAVAIHNRDLIFHHVLVVALIALFVSAAFFGERAGMLSCRRGNKTGTNVWIGIGLAFGTLSIGTFAGSIAAVMGSPSHYRNVSDVLGMLFIPLVSIWFWGGLPAIGLGAVYGGLVKKQLAKLDHVDRESWRRY